MADTAIDLRHMARSLGIPLRQVQAVVELLDDGNTVPFITRYRKDQTGGLDEEQIRRVRGRIAKMRLLMDRKQTILRSIESQGKLTEELAKRIHAAGTTKRLEDLYLPYKPKKQTLATAARERGLEPLAREILEADAACADLDARAADFVNTDRQVPTAADALLGAGHILAEQFSENPELRQQLRDILQRTGKFVCTRIGGDPKPEKKNQPAEEPKPAAANAPEGEPAAKATETPEQAPPSQTPAAAELPDTKTAENESPEAASNGGEAPSEVTPTADENTADENTADENTADENTADDQPAQADIATESATTAAEEPAAEEPSQADAAADTQSPEVSAEASAEQETLPTEESAAGEVAAETVETGSEEVAVEEATVKEEPAEEASNADKAIVAQETSQETPSPQTPAEAEKPVGDKPVSSETKEAYPKAKQPAAKKKPLAKKAPPLSKRELRKKKAEEKKIKAFHDYFDYSEELRKIPPHRVLAINRGERAKVLRVKVECDVEAMHKALDGALVPPEHPYSDYLRGCARDALARLILPSLERELRRELTDVAEVHAVGVFAKNLRNLLLQPPVRERRVLAIDPGFKNGCKMVALDQFGNVLERTVIYLIGKPQRRKVAKQKVIDLINRFQLTVVAIGNGTACRESENFIAELISADLKDRGVAYVIVNEAGASVYSTSRLGREEFPEYDASLRGAISIGRRLQDPLSELVKIDPASVGVGLYQHDVKAKHLRNSVDEVVESCVNYVGVNVNTASPALLRYVSGLNQLTARRIYEFRLQNGPFRNRQQLLEVSGLGETSFVQAAGFLKISGGDNPLDATWIHPESYETSTGVLSSLNCTPADLGGGDLSADAPSELAKRVAEVDLANMAQELRVGELTLRDILTQLARPGHDPREDLPAPIFKQGILKLEDLSPEMELTGTVLNVVDFGCFVDIGLHDSGLVHVSQLADKFVRDPHEVVAVGDIVKVWVKEVDKERRRVSLTMVKPGSQRQRSPKRDEKSESDEAKPVTDREGGRDTSRRQHKPRGGPKGGDRGGPRGAARSNRTAKPKYQPKQPPKPVVPITEDMKAGKKPMRTFGDLAQFFNKKKAPEPKKPEAIQDTDKKKETNEDIGDKNLDENPDKNNGSGDNGSGDDKQ